MYVSFFANVVPYQAVLVLSCAGKPCGSACSMQESCVFDFIEEAGTVVCISLRELILTAYAWAIILESLNALAADF